MNLQEVGNIIFDLGGVLIDIDYQATTNAFHQLGVWDFEQRYSQLNQNSLFDDFEKGVISSQHFINKIMEIVPRGVTPNEIVHAWNAMLGNFPTKKIDLIKKVGLTHRVFMLSNTNSLHLPPVISAWNRVEQRDMNCYFEKVYLSFEIGMRKPDEEVFNWVCNQNNLTPKKTLFIDDSPQHIAGAKKVGLLTYYYQNSEEFYSLFS